MLKGIQEAYEVALDMKSIDTIRTVSSFTEAEQKKSTIVLANKLYGMIVDRLDQIDFKEIEKSEGDITKFKYYNRTRECISVLKGLAKQSGSGVEEIDVIETALNNIESNRLFFIRAYKTDCHRIDRCSGYSRFRQYTDSQFRNQQQHYGNGHRLVRHYSEGNFDRQPENEKNRIVHGTKRQRDYSDIRDFFKQLI